jgi:hypothetical protein
LKTEGIALLVCYRVAVSFNKLFKRTLNSWLASFLAF